MALEPGDKAPDFTLPDQHGNPVSLSGLRGKTVVLYFYPKADTPGCTTQACGIRDHRASYEQADAVVLGRLARSGQADREVRREVRPGLPAAIRRGPRRGGGVRSVGREVRYGRKYMGNERTTFVIGPDGAIRTCSGRSSPTGTTISCSGRWLGARARY